ncbi:MAG: pantoate--beta-alanine ligase [Gemmatimonadales bacterium]|nr:pantoate--beta-alanine ligase [Gemmatimonadales bacterium]
MEVLRDKADLEFLLDLKRDGPMVLVPTMGALHEGHLSLVELGNGLGPVVVSIFVNPTQFGPNEDFESYPRVLENDLDLLGSLDVAAVFAPDVSLMYGDGVGVKVHPGSRSTGLCGEDRPGHFAGVLTVVAKLFGLIQPDIAIFGRKDAQQCLVIDQMVHDLAMPVSLVDGPTLREPDGLAMSSRNRYLDQEQRDRAGCLVKSLRAGRTLLEQGERNPAVLKAIMEKELAPADEILYAEVRRVPDMEIFPSVSGRVLLAVSARVGVTRLIDNFVLEINGDEIREGFLLGTVSC